MIEFLPMFVQRWDEERREEVKTRILGKDGRLESLVVRKSGVGLCSLLRDRWKGRIFGLLNVWGIDTMELKESLSARIIYFFGSRYLYSLLWRVTEGVCAYLD